MKKKAKIILIRVGAYLASIAPILVAIGFNYKDYFKTPYDSVKLGFGGIMCLIILFLKSIQKLKLPEKRVVLYLIVFLMAYFLESILYDMVLLSGMALLGEVIQLPIEKIADKKEKQLDNQNVASETAKAILAITNNNSEEGRV